MYLYTQLISAWARHAPRALGSHVRPAAAVLGAPRGSNPERGFCASPGAHPACSGAACGQRLLCWGPRVGPTLSVDPVNPQGQSAPESAGGSQPWLHVRTTRDSWKILVPHPLPLSPLQRVGTRWSWK